MGQQQATATENHSDEFWDPVQITTELSEKISARTRHICLFLGAGASCVSGLPDTESLKALVQKKLSKENQELSKELFEKHDLETALSRLRRIRTLLGPGQEFEGFNSDTALDLDKKITSAIAKALNQTNLNLCAITYLANWVAGDYYTRPIELFTTNYDLVIEQGLESVGVPYFDGFTGNLKAKFRADLVEQTGSDKDAFPNSFARLWKLHGSLNWLIEDENTVFRTGAPVSEEEVAAIYPSDEKYDQSRRVPFLVLQDRFQRALAEPETLTIIAGYSFSDDHLNEIIFDAARRHPRSEIVAVFRNELPQKIIDTSLPNLSAYGGKNAFIGAEVRPWSKPSAGSPSLIWQNETFQLGDFQRLSEFLGSKRDAGVNSESKEDALSE